MRPCFPHCNYTLIIIIYTDFTEKKSDIVFLELQKSAKVNDQKWLENTSVGRELCNGETSDNDQKISINY